MAAVLQRPPFFFWRCGINRDSDLIYNERVRWKEVRVIDDNNGQLGLLTSEAALELAYSKGLDLIVVAPNATPPVCKIMDFGKVPVRADEAAEGSQEETGHSRDERDEVPTAHRRWRSDREESTPQGIPVRRKPCSRDDHVPRP